jgi:hypothetical protein
MRRHVERELSAWAAEVAAEIRYTGKWDLEGYRRASITAPRWYVVASDGLIIDIEGFVPGLFGIVDLPDIKLDTAPQTIASPAGEKWRIYGRQVAGGAVLVGVQLPEEMADTDAKLMANAAKFGSTLSQAESTKSREIDFNVDFAVVSSTRELRAAWGGLPLRLRSRVSARLGEDIAFAAFNGTPFATYFKPILDQAGQEVGSVIVPKDMTLEMNALRIQDRFNFWAVAISAAFTCLLSLWLLLKEIAGQTRHATLEEALRIGETRTIEFKGSLHWDIRRNEYVEERKLDVLKSIAGFLNAKGGTLFVGVSDGEPPTVRGLREDLERLGSSKDKLQQTLRNLITARIGSEFSPLIADMLETSEGLMYWRILVEESPEPAFVRWKFPGRSDEERKFYVREGPKTSDLDNETTYHYIKNKWG